MGDYCLHLIVSNHEKLDITIPIELVSIVNLFPESQAPSLLLRFHLF